MKGVNGDSTICVVDNELSRMHMPVNIIPVDKKGSFQRINHTIGRIFMYYVLL